MATFPTVFAYGFRPFFLVAGFYATIAVLIWIGFLQGYLPFDTHWPVQTWHAHEMIFGFIVSAITGFLLTAIPSWTGRRGYAGAPLVGLTLVWLLGRIVVTLSAVLPAWLVAVIDLAFLPILAFTLLPALIRSGNRRNLIFIALLVLLFAANLQFHISDGTATASFQFAINVILILVTIVGSRILPVFTASGLRQAGHDIKIRRKPLLDKSILVCVGLLIVADIYNPGPMLVATLASFTTILYCWQLSRWRGRLTVGIPILWVLHIGYAWIPIALLLKATWLLGVGIPATSWLHALTAGAFSTMILGVMSRAALGHTGRALEVVPAITLAYILLNFAALIRVFAPILMPQFWLQSMVVSALLWSTSFILFLIIYTPILCRPRIDGRAG